MLTLGWLARLGFNMAMDRRDFLAGAAIGAGLLAGRIRSAAAQPHDMEPPGGAVLTGRVELAPAGEPGEPMIVSGTVFAPDGRRAMAGLTVYAYHTDARGLYARDGGMMPRLRGWMVTDRAGRYEVRSIRPAPYPNRSIPAHVHFNAWGAGTPRQGFEQLEFEGDPLVTDERMAQSRRLARFGMVRRMERRDGVWRCTFDMRLNESPKD